MSLKKIVKKFIPRSIFYAVRDAVYPEKINVLENRLNTFFLTYYQGIASTAMSQKTAFKNAEFKVWSKHGNDGILLYIFSKIGVANHTFVEVGVEEGKECNTANLSFNFGWGGILIDANEKWIRSARKFYGEKLGARANAIKAEVCFVSPKNIDRFLTDNGVKGEIDLLSIDIDGNDYWVWEAVSSINPRVVVMEYNAALGQRSLTMKYNPDHHYQETYKEHPLYFGASLSALTKLARKKGYILVACDCHGHDAFFVRKDSAEGKFIEQLPKEAFYPNPQTLEKHGSLEKQFEQIKQLAFVEI